MQNVLALLANERPLINIDITLLLNAGVWFVLFFFLRATLWRPMLALIDAREAGTEGARTEAAKLDGEAKALKASLDEKLTVARTAAAKARDALRVEGVAREAEIIGKARTDIAATVEKQRAEIAVERTRLLGEVRALVPELARDMASRVLRREVRS